MYKDEIQEIKINFASLLQIFLLLSRELLTQELGNLIDCPVIFSISGMIECILRINFINILLVFFLLGDSPASEFYMLVYVLLTLSMKMEQTAFHNVSK
jgi:hypothetical protein